MPYYDIDQILMEEERIPCSAKHDSINLSFLNPDARPSSYDPSSSSSKQQQLEVLPKGSKFELPLWAACPLAFSRPSGSLLEVNLPRHFREAFRKKLKAGAEGYDLKQRSAHFYESGAFLCYKISRIKVKARSSSPEVELLRKEGIELRMVLKGAFIGERMRCILDWCLNCRDEDVSDFTKKLADMEMRLFDAGAKASMAHHTWKSDGGKKIAVSSIVKASNAALALQNEKRVVTPPLEEDHYENDKNNKGSKRQRIGAAR